MAAAVTFQRGSSAKPVLPAVEPSFLLTSFSRLVIVLYPVIVPGTTSSAYILLRSLLPRAYRGSFDHSKARPARIRYPLFQVLD